MIKKPIEELDLSASSGQLAITDGTGKLVQQQGGNQSGKLLPVLPVGQGPKAEENTTRALLPSKAPMMIKPKWHAPWKLYRVISGKIFIFTYFPHILSFVQKMNLQREKNTKKE